MKIIKAAKRSTVTYIIRLFTFLDVLERTRPRKIVMSRRSIPGI